MKNRVQRLAAAGGFTMVELVMVIVLVGVISAVAIPKVSGILEETRRSATLKEMSEIRDAIVGSASSLTSGHTAGGCYEGDVGALPTSLSDLATKPGGVASWDRYTQIGWNGPYIDAGGGYQTDAWGNAYQYNAGARTITSTAGGGTAITVRF